MVTHPESTPSPVFPAVMRKQYFWGYGVVVATTVMSLLIWLGSQWYFDEWNDDPFRYVAKVGSMSATTLICWTFILSTRFRAVERLFGGLDKVYKAHRNIGRAAFFLILLHPTFLAIPLIPHWGDFLRFFWFSGDWVRNSGIIALLIFVVLVSVSLWITLRYHAWKHTHHFFGLMLLVVIVHTIVADGEIMTFPVLTVWFFSWLALAVFCFLYIRVLYRWMGPLHDYEVATVSQRGDITEVYLRPLRPGGRMRHRPGQFIYISFDSDTVSPESHPFSISSPPGQQHLRLSVAEVGDWTRTVSDLRGGERARVWGPYGEFGDRIHANPDLDPVMIAGGIGVTPFLSMISDEHFLREGDRSAHLIYSVVKRDEAVYQDEIEALGLDDTLVSITHSSDEDGFLDADVIGEMVGGLDGKMFLICGPAPMMDTLTKDLRERGVGVDRIFTEDFSVA
jgi:predicted ferric reductase